MKYRLLGNSGLRVSEAALGTMTFGEEWGHASTASHRANGPESSASYLEPCPEVCPRTPILSPL